MTHEIIIDATNATLGRLASYSAKQALQGRTIIILNAEKAVITGRKEHIIKDFQERRRRGGISRKGPFHSKDPSRILKRAIRGMLPNYQEGRGRVAFKKIKCYPGVPEKYKESKTLKAGKEKHTSFVSLAEVSRKM